MKERTITNKIGYGLMTALAIIIIFIALFPLIWMLISTFKPSTEIYSIPLTLFPQEPTLENYDIVFQDTAFLRSMLVTALVSGVAVFFSLLVNMLAAYSFAKMNFYGKGLLWAYCLLTMFIPGMTIQLTSFLVVHRLGMLDTLAVLIIPGLASGYSTFFFRQFFASMPQSLDDAAMIDGASRWKVFFTIYVPLSKGPMVLLGTGAFIGYWNSFIWPSMTITNQNLRQIMQLIRAMNSIYANNDGAVLAGTAVAILPPIILFLIFHKQIIRSNILTGVKA